MPRTLAAALMIAAAAAPVAAQPASGAGPGQGGGGGGGGGGRDAYLARLAADVARRLGAIAEARAPKLVPPVPIKVRWRPVRLGSLELGAPLAALAAADLDGDGRGELYAVTARDVVAIGIRGSRASELGRVAFAGPPAVPAPRDPVGAAVIDGRELVAAVSAWGSELRVAWQGKQLAGQPVALGAAGLLVCPGERAALAPGRNYFGPAAAPFYAARCRGDLVDAGGHPLRVRAQLALTGKLAVAIERCAAGGGACQPLPAVELAGAGAAFEVADVDRDGTPEVIVSDDAAPGDPDFVRVVSLAGPPPGRALYTKTFQAGVAGIAAVDTDGDGAVEVIAAVRLAGATRVDLWRMQ